MLRRQAELESAQSRLQLQVLTDECSKLRKQVQVSLTLLIHREFPFSSTCLLHVPLEERRQASSFNKQQDLVNSIGKSSGVS